MIAAVFEVQIKEGKQEEYLQIAAKLQEHLVRFCLPYSSSPNNPIWSKRCFSTLNGKGKKRGHSSKRLAAGCLQLRKHFRQRGFTAFSSGEGFIVLSNQGHASTISGQRLAGKEII